MTSPPRVLKLQNGVAVLHAEATALIGCSDGLMTEWISRGLPRRGPDLVLFPDTSPLLVAGLFAVLAQAQRAGRKTPMRVVSAMDDEVAPALVAAWLQAERDGFPVELEGELPGATVSVGPFEVRAVPAVGGIGFELTVGGESHSFRPSRGG
jgi:hypothetical protein